MRQDEIKQIVRNRYSRIATKGETCCAPSTGCCGDSIAVRDISMKIGYSKEDLQAVPEGSNLGLGCGNPVAIAALKAGETVLDLGSGAGFDCFLAAGKVGNTGRVIGVDMTPDMVDRARENARKDGFGNVEFRLGEIENLPAADNSVDAVISNCVINLSPDKRRVFEETFRVLKPGGRLMVSDIVLLRALPAALKDSIEAYVGCLAGAVMKNEYTDSIKAAGFRDVRIIEEKSFSAMFTANDPTVQRAAKGLAQPVDKVADTAGSFASIRVSAVKPD